VTAQAVSLRKKIEAPKRFYSLAIHELDLSSLPSRLRRGLPSLTMADPLSIGASIVAFIGLADKVIRACTYCIETIKDAPKDIQMILGEVTSLRAVVDSLSAAELHDTTVKLIPSLFEKMGPVEACRSCLSALEGLLPTVAYQASSNRRYTINMMELAWPLKESKARKLLAEISLHKSTLLLAISGDIMLVAASQFRPSPFWATPNTTFC